MNPPVAITVPEAAAYRLRCLSVLGIREAIGPAYSGLLAKVLLEIEDRGDRSRAEGWFAKYDRMPADLTKALAATKNIPVDLDPRFSFPDEVR